MTTQMLLMTTQMRFETEYEEDFEPSAIIESFRSSVGKKTVYYPSNSQGQFILNAVTGIEYPYRTGSLEARQLFKVVDTIGTCDNKGFKLKKNALEYPNPSPNHCYYDNPQQYVTHRRMTVQPELIERWNKTQEELKQQRM